MKILKVVYLSEDIGGRSSPTSCPGRKGGFMGYGRGGGRLGTVWDRVVIR